MLLQIRQYPKRHGSNTQEYTTLVEETDIHAID